MKDLAKAMEIADGFALLEEWSQEQAEMWGEVLDSLNNQDEELAFLSAYRSLFK